MTARFMFTDDPFILNGKYIPGLAANVFKVGGDDPSKLQSLGKRRLIKDKAMTLPDDQFLVIAGTTAELKEFRNGLTGLDGGVDRIQCTSSRPPSDTDELVTWCVRVKVKHPDTKVEQSTTVTMLVMGRERRFDKVASEAPSAPWKWFDVVGLRGHLKMWLDDRFDAALEDARKRKSVN